MKRLITFSLWGTKPNYHQGAIENARIAPSVYPGWTTRFYCCKDVPENVRQELASLGAEVLTARMIKEDEPWEGLYWRFFPAADYTVERFITRDTDSLLNAREKAAVDEWITSGVKFHLMRDNAKSHDAKILGGMWGCVGGLFPQIHTMMHHHAKYHKWGEDQVFLERCIWPLIKNCHMAHDDYSQISPNECTRKFPPHDKLPENIQHVGSYAFRT